MKPTAKFLYVLALFTFFSYVGIVILTWTLTDIGWHAAWVLGPLGALTGVVMGIFIAEAKRAQKASNKLRDHKERYVSPNKNK